MTATSTVDTSPLPFTARGPLSAAVMRHLTEGDARLDHTALAREALAHATDVIRDEDIQVALFTLYASSYGSLAPLDAQLEWDPRLLATRSVLEDAFEAALRAEVTVPEVAVPEVTDPGAPAPAAAHVARALFDLTQPSGPPSVAAFIARHATLEQARELMIQRSVYTLREADPHSWAIPRLHGRAKAALVEIQADEYGGGRPDRMHATIFARTMRGMGLDDTYGAYVDAVPALALAAHNAMSLFGLNRRLLGAIVGHLAAFEMTSSIPSRKIADGLRRLGLGDDVTDYYDEHVEADAVHEQIAARDLAGALVEDSPELIEDVMFGAAACLALDDWWGEQMLEAWKAGETSLRSGADR